MESKRSELISYSLIRSTRRSIGIIVKTDGSVVVRAPHRATIKQIEDVLNKKADWILKQKKKFEDLESSYLKREFIDGEKHLLLGKEYVLRVKIAPYNRVTLETDFIVVECKEKLLVKYLIEEWYRQKANELMPSIMTPLIKKFNDLYNVSPKKISLKSMKSRWGSCTSNRNISMNIKLIKSEDKCIEYVIAHELCHLIHMNHSKNFYALLTEFMPDWRDRKIVRDKYII